MDSPPGKSARHRRCGALTTDRRTVVAVLVLLVVTLEFLWPSLRAGRVFETMNETEKDNPVFNEDNASINLESRLERYLQVDWANVPVACKMQNSPDLSNSPPNLYWAVLTTSTAEPTAAVRRLLRLEGWKVVVVSSRSETVDLGKWSHPNCVYISIADQKAMGYRVGSVAHSFETEPGAVNKNVGYMYAIAHGATTIYDVDEATVLAAEPAINSTVRISFLAGHCETVSVVRSPSIAKYGVYNVYGHFGQPTVWPRGFPIEAVATGPGRDARAQTIFEHASRLPVAVEQGLENGAPDVDAIFRMVRVNDNEPIRMMFSETAPPLVLAAGTMSALNDKNTIFHHTALWATLLPVSKGSAVGSTWRGYWAQRLLWDTGFHVLFRGASAYREHKASATSNLQEMLGRESEAIMSAGKLVRFLLEWKSEHPHLFGRVMNLTVSMAHAGYITWDDVDTTFLWLQDLVDVCYEPPSVDPLLPPNQPSIPNFAAVVPDACTNHSANHNFSVPRDEADDRRPVGNRGTPAQPTTILGCGNYCNATADVPIFLADDVVVYAITFPGRHEMMRMIRRTWGRHVRRLVIFTSERDDPTIPTYFLPDPHPQWVLHDRRQGVYAAEVVPHLLNLQPPAKFFINVDDDTVPLLDKVDAYLEKFKLEHAGAYPYLAMMPNWLDGAQQLRTAYEEQRDLAAEVFLNGTAPIVFPGGPMYAFNRTFLQELLPVYRTCPTIPSGDGNVGALMFCSKIAQGMSPKDLPLFWRFNVDEAMISRTGYRDHEFLNDTSSVLDWHRPTFYHAVRPEKETFRVYMNTYVRYFGISTFKTPDMSVIFEP